MRAHFKSWLTQTLLCEGGKAIKGSHSLTQQEARSAADQAIKLLARELGLPVDKFSCIGSAGKKPSDQLSADVDIAVETRDINGLKRCIERLAHNKQYKHMPGLGVYSFCMLVGGLPRQIDVMPVSNLQLAKWAYHNDERDLVNGLKGAHRNEVLFSLAKHVNKEVLAKQEDEPISWRRLAFDPNTGLSTVLKQRLVGAKGKLLRAATAERQHITANIDEIARCLFGKSFSACNLMTFDDVMDALDSPSFDYKHIRGDILREIALGLTSKALILPPRLVAALANLHNESASFTASSTPSE